MAARYFVDPNPEWDWLDQLKVGDILLERGKTERVVRSVSFNKVGTLRYVQFVIRRCSWTGSCTTSINRHELKTRGFVHSGKRKESIAMVDKLIAHDILYGWRAKRRLDCCDVKGLR